nr:retrovirus-related Pol polyprotein from transposon TNT 1-94 [Tanacetum cinerariifolium]
MSGLVKHDLEGYEFEKICNDDKSLSEIQLEHKKEDEFVVMVMKVVYECRHWMDYCVNQGWWRCCEVGLSFDLLRVCMMVVKEIVNRLLEKVKENGVALDEEQLLFIAGGKDNAVNEDVDEQPVQDLALNMDNVFQADDCDAFDSNVDEASTAQTMFLVNLSSAYHVYNEVGPSYDLDILSEAKAAKPVRALTVYPPNTPVKLVPRVLPTKIQVKINIFALIQLFSKLEKTCKKRITPTGLTEGERGFEQTKECYLTKVITFFKMLKEHFEGIQKALTKEMKAIFDELEAEVDQNAVNRKCDEIEWKNLLITNNNLIENYLSKKVFYIATNSKLNVSRFSEMHDAHTVVQARCLELEIELSKLKDKIQKGDHDVMVKRFSNLEAAKKHMAVDRSRLRNFMKKFLETVRFRNDHFGAIIGYGDYMIGDNVISRVYYVEGLGHNLFFVGQFCDSDLEVAFRKHSCYVQDTNGVELIKGSRGSNCYTISVKDIMKSSPICLLSKAFKTKSWLWHCRLDYLNFGTINDLARKDLVRGLPRLKLKKIIFASRVN